MMASILRVMAKGEMHERLVTLFRSVAVPSKYYVYKSIQCQDKTCDVMLTIGVIG